MDNDEPAESSRWLKKKAPPSAPPVCNLSSLSHVTVCEEVLASTALSNTQASIFSVDSLDDRPLQGHYITPHSTEKINEYRYY
jgi:hypothetical protein